MRLVNIYLHIQWLREYIFQGKHDLSEEKTKVFFETLAHQIQSCDEWNNIHEELIQLCDCIRIIDNNIKEYIFLSKNPEYQNEYDEFIQCLTKQINPPPPPSPETFEWNGRTMILHSSSDWIQPWHAPKHLQMPIFRFQPSGQEIDRARMGLLEKMGALHPRILFCLNITCFGNESSFVTSDYAFPIIDSAPISLHQDADVRAQLGSSEVAKREIKKATANNLGRYNFLLKELIRNSRDAQASTIDINMHQAQDKSLILTFEDDGSGLDKEGLRALKIPGISTKSVRGDCYGMGFFSVFSEFDQVTVITSSSGSEQHTLLFTKNRDGTLTLQTTSKKGTFQRSTKIILKKQYTDTIPIIEAGLIDVELRTLVSQLSDVSIRINGKDVSIQSVPLCSRTESFYSDTQKQFVEVRARQRGDGGLYREELRIGTVPQEIYDLLPPSLLAWLQREKICFHIMIPDDSEQTINRAQLIKNEPMIQAIQRGVLVTTLQVILHFWTRGEMLYLLSDDYWNEFDKFNNALSGFTQSMVKVITQRTWIHLHEDREIPIAHQIINQVKTEITALTQGKKVSFPFLPKDSSSNIDEVISVLFDLVCRQDKTSPHQMIKEKLYSVPRLIELLANLPLEESGPSFMDIRRAFIHELQQCQLLKDYEFDYEFIAKNDVSKLLDNVMENIRSRFISETHEVIIKKFETAIQQKIIIRKQQTVESAKQPEVEPKKYEPLSDFLKCGAKKLWNREIQVVFEYKADNAIARARQNTNIMIVNTHKKERLERFMSFCDELKKKDVTKVLNDNMDILTDWLDTLCHEMTHMDEKKGSPTHDLQFYSSLGAKISHIFDCQHSFDIIRNALQDALSLSEEPLTKKRKIE